ncbi:unnamed protein product [Rotaria sp. Silwood2]|nr:unnamed protein product [Rotaria sp. Silwood2]CAF3186775.1 unnamed protein product [Rotaria sp. Silwood2]CAF4394478.1 unnamed protein product [Rotaria sp. Silwood2]
MDEYRDLELLTEKIRSTFSTNDQHDYEKKQKIFSDDTEQRLEKIAERINRENRINASINGSEPQVHLEQCSECGCTGGIVSIIHSKEVCSSKRNENNYRYNDQENVMVCDACRKLEKISVTKIECSKCGIERKIISFL